MKAKLLVSNKIMEIKLSNGVQFFATEGEDKETFVERVSEVVDRDYVDTLELEEVKVEDVKVEAETVSPEKAAVKPKEKAAAKPKEKKEPKPKEKKEIPSLESAIEAAALAKNNVDTVCTFVPFRTAIKTVGEVKQVVIDRRVNKAYYRIIGQKDGKLYHISVNSDSFKVDEEATEKMLDKREAEAAKIADEKKAKAAAAKPKAPAKEKAAPKKTAAKPKTADKPATGAATKGKGWSKTGNSKK